MPMTDLEKQIEFKRARADAFRNDRTAVAVPEENKEPNFFAQTTQASPVTTLSLREFKTDYKPLDLQKEFTRIEQQKAQQREVEVVVQKPQVQPKPQQVKKPYDDEFENITRMPGGTTVYEVPAPQQYQESWTDKVGLRINLRGKLVIFVASIAMLCLLFLAIFNAVVMGNLRTEINSINREIVLEEQILRGLLVEQELLLDDGHIQGRLEGHELEDLTIVEYDLLERVAVDAARRGGNWFETFAAFVYRLFGGR